jgi:CHAT domain-containing protein
MAEALGADPASALALGDAATETAVKSAALADARILAFATHGLVTGELMGLAEPALVFTPPEKASDIDDGLLTASEAAQLDLAADWVVLSACNTAAGDGTPGAEGLSGLARAFLYAGARAILVSHWPVRDDAAAALTTSAFANLKSEPEIGRAEALRRAMLSVMENPDDPTLAHPSAWAPFVVVGEGG